MGAWATALMSNDTALDELGEFVDQLRDDLDAAEDVERALGLLAVILQLAPYLLDEEVDEDTAGEIRDVAGAALPEASPAGQVVLRAIAEKKPLPEGESLAPDLAHLLTDTPNSPFGPRFPALFESEGARAVVQEVVDRVVAQVDAELAHESVTTDLCNEALSMGPLGALLVLAPATLPAATILGWRERTRAGLARLESDGNEELEFHRPYHANLEGVLNVLIRRAG